jgi:hypothetical protein
VRLSPADAHVLASELALDYATVPICLACLTFVSFPLDLGRLREARREAVQFAPHFWEEGLADSTRHPLEQACERGVERAAEAIRELDRVGARSELVTAIVLQLAHAQVDELRTRR